MFQRRKTGLHCAIRRGGLGASAYGRSAEVHRRGSERRTLPPGLENSGLLSPRPGAILRARFFPHAENIPPPPSGPGNKGCLQLGGEPRPHTPEIFSGSKNHRAARIMRAPARPGCGHISRTKRPPAPCGCDPGSVHRFGYQTAGIIRHGKAREGACMRVGI